MIMSRQANASAEGLNQSGHRTQIRTCPRAIQQGHVECGRHITVPPVLTKEAIPEKGGSKNGWPSQVTLPFEYQTPTRPVFRWLQYKYLFHASVWSCDLPMCKVGPFTTFIAFPSVSFSYIFLNFNSGLDTFYFYCTLKPNFVESIPQSVF